MKSWQICSWFQLYDLKCILYGCNSLVSKLVDVKNILSHNHNKSLSQHQSFVKSIVKFSTHNKSSTQYNLGPQTDK